MSRDEFLQSIEQFLAATGMSATRLGTEALGDPNFVFDLRSGRSPGLNTADKVTAWMRENRDTAAPDKPEAA